MPNYVIQVQVIDYSKSYSRSGSIADSGAGTGRVIKPPGTKNPKKETKFHNKFLKWMHDRFGADRTTTFKVLAYGRRVAGIALEAAKNVVNLSFRERQFNLQTQGNTRQAQIEGNKRIIAQNLLSIGGGFIRAGILSLGTSGIFMAFEAVKVGIELTWRFAELQQELEHFRRQQSLQNHLTLYERNRLVNNVVKSRGLQ